MADEFDQYKVSASSGDEFAQYKVASPESLMTPPGMPKLPVPDMQTSFLGSLLGGDAQAPAMPDRGGRNMAADIQAHPKTAEAAGALSLAGGIAGASELASPIVAPMATAVGKAITKHPFLTMLGIEAAKRAPVVGPMLEKVPGLEWLPFLAGKGEAPGVSRITNLAQKAAAESEAIAPALEGEAQSVPLSKLPIAKGNPYAGSRTPQSMEPAQSTNIGLHGYEPSSKTMLVQFKNGRVYEYRGVPEEVFNAYRNSESQGSFFANNIKGRYETNFRGTVKPTAGSQARKALGASR